MADYINKNILCEAYIHIRLEHTSPARQEAYLHELKEFARKRARFFLYDEVELDLRHKKGSLTLYVTILGTIGALYKGIGEYPKFREGAMVAFEDVKRLADTIISEGLFGARAKKKQIVRLEARAGVVGSLRKIVGQLEMVKQSDGSRSGGWMAAKITATHEDISLLMGNLRSEKDKEFVISGLEDLVDQLPIVPAPMRRKPQNSADIEAYKAARTDLLTYLRDQHR
jgi:hypothetical protein